ncbi:MAG: SLAC1 anion channel family protein [Moraxellaceae bacterium]
MNENTTFVTAGRPRFDYLPVSFFGAVMGLTGLSVAWRLAAVRYGVPEWIAGSLGTVAVIVFLALCIGYGLKIASAWGAVQAEFRHPIAGNLFGTILISLLLLPIVLKGTSLLAARVLWILGAAGMVVFALLIVNRWMSNRQQLLHATPTWIVPVVGLLDLPLALPGLELPPMHGLAMFALAVGLFFTIPLFTIIFSRLLFEDPMPDALRPSLMILVAPFAVGYSAYTTVTGQVDHFAEALYMLTLFMLAVSLNQIRHLASCCPFRVSWWAISFPLAASAIAALRFAASRPSGFSDVIACVVLALATLIVGALLGRTLIGLVRGELRTLSG